MKWLDTNRIKEIIQKVEAGIIKVPITLVPLYSLAKHYLESPQPETIEPERKWSDEERDLFALSFLVFALNDPRAVALLESKTPPGKVLDFYKDRAFIDNDTSKQ